MWHSLDDLRVRLLNHLIQPRRSLSEDVWVLPEPNKDGGDSGVLQNQLVITLMERATHDSSTERGAHVDTDKERVQDDRPIGQLLLLP
jgi:hypothetical protein